MAVAASMLLVAAPRLGMESAHADQPEPACTVSVNPMDLATPVDSEWGFTIWTSGDASFTNSETEGSIAVGGMARFGGNNQYPVHQKKAGNGDYGLPKIDGDVTRVLLNGFSDQSTIVQVMDEEDSSGNVGVAKIVRPDLTKGFVFMRDSFDNKGTTFAPVNANNQSPQIRSYGSTWQKPAGLPSMTTKRASFEEYFPNSSGESVLGEANVSRNPWVSPTKVNVGGEVEVTLNDSAPNRMVLSEFENVAKFKFVDEASSGHNAVGAAQPLVIYVSQEDVQNGTLTVPTYGYSAAEGIHAANTSNILFDLSDVTGNVNLIGAGDNSIRGSFYAPNADITIGSNLFEGQLIAKSLIASASGQEIHTNHFVGLTFTSERTCETGTFSVSKALAGVSAGKFPAGTEFEVNASWEGGSATLLLPVDGSPVTYNGELPVGTVVTFAEVSPVVPAGFELVSAQVSPSRITVGDEVAKVLVTNTYSEIPVEEPTGTFSVSKALAGVSADEFPAGTEFEVNASWEDGSANLLLPVDGSPVTYDGELPVGTVVTLTENVLDVVEPEGYEFAGADLSQASLVIGAEETVQVLVTNSYVPNVPKQPGEGSFEVSKSLAGVDADAFEPGTTFPVTASWEGGSATLLLPVDGSSVAYQGALPVGTLVSLTEGATEEPVGYRFAGASFSEDSFRILEDQQNVEVELTNAYEPQQTAPETGTFSVAKELVGAPASLFPDGFPVRASWEEDGQPLEELLILPADGTPVASSTSLPVGTQVSITELDAATPEGYLLVDAQVDEEAFSIAADPVHVTVTNTYGEIEVRPAEAAIGSKARVEGSSTNTLALTGGTVTDTVYYRNLVAGVEYELHGSIHKAGTGEAVEILSSAVFVPEGTNGETQVVFTISAEEASLHEGDDLVVYEVLTRDGEVVAEHVDPLDLEQTFSVARRDVTPEEPEDWEVPEVEKSPETPKQPVTEPREQPEEQTIEKQLPKTGSAGVLLAGGLGLTLIVGGVAVLVRRRWQH